MVPIKFFTRLLLALFASAGVIAWTIFSGMAIYFFEYCDPARCQVLGAQANVGGVFRNAAGYALDWISLFVPEIVFHHFHRACRC